MNPNELFKITPENSQDLFLMRSDNSDIVRIPWKEYRKKAPKIEWFTSNKKKHTFFRTADNSQPENLMGPAITKVLPWNLETIDVPDCAQGHIFKPGYLIDLRQVHMSRLLNPVLRECFERELIKRNGINLDNVDTKTSYTQEVTYNKRRPLKKILKGHCTENPSGYIPCERRYELDHVPFDNLYIVSWKDPLKVHDLYDYGAYQINYMSVKHLDKMQPASLRSSGITGVILENYFKRAGVQVGALNPTDWEYLSVHGACYIANLNTFNK